MVGRPSVFIVQPVPEVALGDLRSIASVQMFSELDRTISRSELLRGVRRANYLWVLGEIAIDAAIMDAGPLKLIAIMEIFPKSVDIGAATVRGIPVTTLANLDGITTSTAEHTIALMFALARRLPQGERQVRAGDWTQYQSMSVMGTRLGSKVLGIVGLGNVGRKVARIARGADMRVLYTDRAQLDAATEHELGVEWRDLDDLFREVDVLALSPTLTEATKGLVDSSLLSLMKPTALLVNTSRGQVVNEADLVEALRAGQLAGAALDVFEHEPPTVPNGGPSLELLSLPNVIVTPHMGTATLETRIEQARLVAAGLIADINGSRPPHVVNPEVFGDPPRPWTDRIG